MFVHGDHLLWAQTDLKFGGLSLNAWKLSLPCLQTPDTFRYGELMTVVQLRYWICFVAVPPRKATITMLLDVCFDTLQIDNV